MIDLSIDKPVISLTGNEFLPMEGIPFAKQILDFFNAQGGTASPQSQGSIEKILSELHISK